ncbi:MAG TPA: threonine aldolase family protein [Symbiobacteriaceae bacterium]|nr:threonine aldolase family protein [Symbiobacteriaceae bacterium]
MSSHIIDLRSDTVTQPTEAMRDAMRNAVVGDDILGEDPTVQELEELAASMLGKEAGLFVTSGTMGNQVSIMTLAGRGEEIILGRDSHMFHLEVGALSALCQVQAVPVTVTGGRYDPEEIERAIRPKGIQLARTAAICVEQTYNLNLGLVVKPANIAELRRLADANGIPIFMDGARVFNAATALGVDVKEMVRDADVVQFCLSKGLSAPIGSLVVGSRDFIDRARLMRQRIGGGMRQAGVIAAPGIVALKEMVSRLQEDHDHARMLALGLSQVAGIQVNLAEVQTNIVGAEVTGLPGGVDGFLAGLAAEGIKAKKTGPASFRMVTHRGIVANDIAFVIAVCRRVAAQGSR